MITKAIQIYGEISDEKNMKIAQKNLIEIEKYHQIKPKNGKFQEFGVEGEQIQRTNLPEEPYGDIQRQIAIDDDQKDE